MGWGVPVEKVERLLGGGEEDSSLYPSKDFKSAILASIIDGPIDVDKTDYLVRDSFKTFLPYGRLIDLDRLIRHVTGVICKDDQDNTIVTLGTYEKGQSAAESLTFARYFLDQSLYWHHTLRAARTMLREAGRSAMKAWRRKKTVVSALDGLLGISSASSPSFVTNEMVLDLIAEWADEPGKELVSMIKGLL